MKIKPKASPPVGHLALAFLLWSLNCAGLAGLIGCSGGCAAGKGQYNPTTGLYDTNAPADVLVVTVENTRKNAADAFAALMKVERENEAALRQISVEIHNFAEVLRRDSEKWLDALTEAKVAYQKSRSAEDATALKNALAVVQSGLNSAINNLAAAAARKATPQ